MVLFKYNGSVNNTTTDLWTWKLRSSFCL